MAIELIDLGGVANDGTGDSLRSGGQKINDSISNLSGRTDTLEGDVNPHIADTDLHVSDADRGRWDASVSGVTDHTVLLNIGVKTHVEIDEHITGTTNPHSVTATQVGLGNVDNTADADKPISTATQTALDGKSATGHTHNISDVTGFTDNSTQWDEAYSWGDHSLVGYLTGTTSTDNDYVTGGTFNQLNGEVTLTRLSGGTVVYDLDGRYSLTGHTHSEFALESGLATHTGDTANPHSVSATQVGLGNVDNTSDADKPVSTAQQTALDLKADQADLVTHTGDTSNPHSVDKTDVGLSNVDNTSDVNKPISTATQTALDDKVDLSGDTMTGDLTAPNIISNNQATLNSHVVRLDQMNSAIAGLDWQESILGQVDFTTAEPTPNTEGDRYINTVTGNGQITTGTVFIIDNIYQWVSGAWVEHVPNAGWTVWDEGLNTNYTYNGTNWVEFGSTVNHNNTSGLQGGTAAEYYHMTQAEHANIGDWDTAFGWGDHSAGGYSAQADLVTHTGDTANPHSVTKTQVGLSNVDNTSDADKPVSTAQQTALDLKTDDTEFVIHTGDTTNPHSVTKTQVGLSNVDNTSDANKPISDATQTALDLKTDDTEFVIHTGDTTNPHSVTQTQVGLSNVDNTSDVNKPISTATQTALDNKTDSTSFSLHTGNSNNPHSVNLEQARTANNVLAGNIDFNNNSIDNLSGLTFSGGTDITWNNEFKTLNIPSGGGPVLQVGQETYVYFHNDSGVQINNGQVVQITGTTLIGTEYLPTGRLAKADRFETIDGSLFIATQNIADGSEGMVTKFGRVSDMNTSGFTSGDALYVSAIEAGGVVNVKPEFPNFEIVVGVALKIDSSTGQIGVDFEADIHDTFINAWNGVFRESADFIVTATGSTIQGTLEATGGGDLTMIFSDGFSRLDCTPPQEITLTAGTDTTPQVNLIYVDKTTKQLVVSLTDWPTTEHIKIANTLCTSVSGTSTYGVLSNRNWNDHVMSINDNGHISHMTERMRQISAEWDSGASGSCTVSGGTNVFLTVTSGKVYQLHKQTWNALDMVPPGTDDAVIVNNFTNPYEIVTDLNTQTVDALGVTLANSSFSMVLWGVQNKTNTQSHLMINLPTGKYAKNDPAAAVSDASNFSVFSIPNSFKGQGFLIARFTFTLDSGGTVWTLEDTEDLRGKVPNSTAGGGGGGAGVTDLLGLTDTPSSYVGEGLKFMQVQSGETATQFANITESDIIDLQDYSLTGHTHALSGLTDTNVGVPTDGQALTWNDSTQEWSATTISVSGVTGGGLSADTVGITELKPELKALVAYTGATVVDWTEGIQHDHIMTGNTTFSFSGYTVGKTITMALEGTTSGYDPTFPTGVLTGETTDYDNTLLNYVQIYCANADEPHFLTSIRTRTGLHVVVGSSLLTGLISYWSMEDAAGTTMVDDHGSYDGTTANVTEGVTGKVANAFDYNGSNSTATVSDNADLDLTGDFTVSQWLRVDVRPATDMAHISKETAGTSGWMTYLGLTGAGAGEVTFNMFTYGLTNSAHEVPTNLNVGTWYHMVCTYDGTDVKIYMDGTEDYTLATTGSMTADARDLIFGKYQSNPTRYTEMTLDEVGIWSKALSPSEVTELYNSGSGVAYPF